MDGMKRIHAAFYESRCGNVPVREWLLSLDKDDRRAIGEDIATVEFGWPIGMPVCRPLGQRLWEVRSTISSNRIARVMFSISNDRMVLLHGFVKKTQQTTLSDLTPGAQETEGDRAMKARTKKRARVGQSFDEFLQQEGTREAVHATAIKRVIAWQLAEAMKEQRISKSEMARRMSTSRSQLDRLLDPNVEAIELQTLARAAHVLGRNLRVELV